jgi:catechol 2,3-dioxygenase-like lactoylglutathione lyase family enzyme
MARRLHHIAIGALDVERLADFYGDLFSLPEVARHRDDMGHLRSIWLGMADGVLMIERTVATRPRVDGVGAGPFITVFHTTTDERTLLEQKCESLAAPVEERTTFTSYTRDPEGNRVGFSTWPVLSVPTTA